VTDLVICGIRGRMGQALAGIAAASGDLRILAGIDREPAEGSAAEAFGCPEIVRLEEAADAITRADVLVDFSSAPATRELVRAAAPALKGRALVVGTTGLDAATEQSLDALGRSAAVLVAANFSIGVNVLLGVAERLGAVLDTAAYDVEIVEAHHRGKTDAPSGTALALGRAVAAGRGVALDKLRRDGRSGDTGARPAGQIAFHALRGGGIAGEHRVLFLGGSETIELRHEALDRTLFAEGALHAARWLAGRAPGRYGMKDVLGL
jgi:4-hydroxy-tetrahydrodipicolinate reductase